MHAQHCFRGGGTSCLPTSHEDMWRGVAVGLVQNVGTCVELCMLFPCSCECVYIVALCARRFVRLL